MRFLGLDYGEKTIGVSVSDALGLISSGVCVIRRKTPHLLDESIARIGEIIKEYEADTIILGYPKNMNNTEGPKCAAVKLFQARLKEKLDIPVILQDERLSTVAAERVLIDADLSRDKRKNVIDKMAAVYILQGYLDKINWNKNKKEEVDFMSGINDELDDESLEDEVFETITMTTEDGESIEFIISDTVEIDGATFIVVFEADYDPEEDEDQDAYIFKQVGEEGEEYVYEEVTEEEFNKVAQMLAETSDEYDIEDMDDDDEE